MFSRLSQVARHLSRPPGPIHASLTAAPSRLARRDIMASAADRSARTIHTAACLIIGDEVLGGKTKDTNSSYMAKWCFSLGIDLKRVEVIPDDESDIVEAVRRMSDKYDFVVTSGGIGPTHDDITYQAIAKAFGLKLKLYDEALERMKRMQKSRGPTQVKFSWDEDSPVRAAKYRMIELPTDESRALKDQFVFPLDDAWVPIAIVNGNVHILPGVPRLFEGLLDGLKKTIVHRLVNPDGTGTCRVLISTPLGESSVAAYLTELASRVGPKGVKVGSYPRWDKLRNTVTLVGRDKAVLDSITPEVIENVKGRLVTVEGEDDDLPDDA